MATTHQNSESVPTVDIKVRWALPDDLPAAMELARSLHAEANWYSERPFDLAHTERQYLSRLVGGDYFSFIAEVNGELAGVVFGFFVDLLTTPSKVAVEEILYVKPEYRNRRVGFALISEMEKWAAFKGADFVQIGISTGITPEKTDQLYRRNGFARYSDSYIKEVSHER